MTLPIVSRIGLIQTTGTSLTFEVGFVARPDTSCTITATRGRSAASVLTSTAEIILVAHEGMSGRAHSTSAMVTNTAAPSKVGPIALSTVRAP